jgi:branched-chain amino acid transport system permease protein
MTRTSIALLLLVAGIAALPLFGGAYALRVGTIACMYAVLALSWNIVGGFAGYPSFATAAFFGLGSYATGILINLGTPFPLAVVAATLICLGLASVLGAVLGAVLLRLRGHYFAIASLSLVEVFRELVNNATDLTGGGMGLNIPLASGSGVLAEATFFFFAMWGLLLLTAVVVIFVSSSMLGFGLNCIRQNETASSMIGLNVTLYKSAAFGLSTCFVAAAGGIYAAWVHYIDPSDVFDILYSVKPIVMALMGGLGSPLGVVCGALVYLGLEEVVWRNYIQIHSGVLGVLIIMLLLFLPHGLISLRAGMLWRRATHV